MRSALRSCVLAGVVLTSSLVDAAVPALIPGNEQSIKDVASTIAFGTMQYYTYNQSGQIPGKINGTWWEGGFLFNMLMQYWYFTGDTSYNPTVTQGMLWQAGDNNDYLPVNWTSDMGNDDQLFWGLAALTGAELSFPQAPNQDVSWLALAQGVFNTQAVLWDATTCGGGLRWQKNSLNPGWPIKNAVTNGGFFQLAARLALYTGNQTYADWAVKMWDWCAASPLLDEDRWYVADTTSTPNNCTTAGNQQWTYNYGVFFFGAAAMYNFTKGDEIWKTRVDGLLGSFYKTFFPPAYGGMILAEPECDVIGKCNRDNDCFKGLVSSWMAFTTYWVPETAVDILPRLHASGIAAAATCIGAPDGDQCNYRWWQNTSDNDPGLEQEASTLSIVTVQLLGLAGKPAPLTSSTGGTSKSDPGNAGGVGVDLPEVLASVTTGDRVGAGILTALVAAVSVGGCVWLLSP